MASPDEGSVTADPVVDELLPGGPAADPEDVDRA
jgi:hypothetical protein